MAFGSAPAQHKRRMQQGDSQRENGRVKRGHQRRWTRDAQQEHVKRQDARRPSAVERRQDNAKRCATAGNHNDFEVSVACVRARACACAPAREIHLRHTMCQEGERSHAVVGYPCFPAYARAPHSCANTHSSLSHMMKPADLHACCVACGQSRLLQHPK